MQINLHEVASLAFGAASPLVVVVTIFIGAAILVGWFQIQENFGLDIRAAWTGFFVLLGLFVAAVAVFIFIFEK